MLEKMIEPIDAAPIPTIMADKAEIEGVGGGQA
jgi:hypothetical protein